MINLNLDWKDEIKTLHGTLMGVTSRLNNRQITTLQASMIVEQVLLPRMEAGLRHANISQTKLAHWSTITTRAIARCAGTKESIRPAGMALALGIHTIQSLHKVSKIMAMMIGLTEEGDLQNTRNGKYEEAQNMGQNKHKWNRYVETTNIAKQLNLDIRHNKHRRNTTDVRP